MGFERSVAHRLKKQSLIQHNINIQSAEEMISTILPQQQQQTLTYNYPCGDLLERGRRREFISICVPLYKASIKGDWEAARIILKGHENMVRYSVTEIKETPLHLASRARSCEFVRHLVDMMEEEDLKLQNKDGNTAFCLAAIAGDVRLAKIMVAKNRELLTIRGSGNMMPLYLAASNSSHEMVKYLYCEQMATDGWTDDDWNLVFIKCIECELFDVAIRILNDHEEGVLRQEESIWNVLYLLAKKPYAFYEIQQPVFNRVINSIYEVFHLKKEPFTVTESDAIQLLRKVWKKVALKPTDEIDVILQGPVLKIAEKDRHPSHVLFIAAEMCNIKFLVELIDEYPDLIWKRNDDGQTIFHIAAFHRHESIYGLLYEIGSMKDTVTQIKDKEGNNMLHSVAMNSGKNPHDNVWGAAYQMRHELLWFKEVSSMVSPESKEMKNAEGLTPSELFSKNHKALALEGEALIKDTIGQSMVASTLIFTIGFSVVFTIPEGGKRCDDIRENGGELQVSGKFPA
ncbi:uncharacterized protein LOC143633206 [Bidens hawaiensis]|uniref:uncharacterized protein LOC143633206 n=1 Tax=Bidens hawaiensis TaxID=980011 RepID=UPI0040494586